MSDWIDPDGYRANVGIILMNHDGCLFWAGRAGRQGWQFPQGGILRHESPEQAMYRELEEEIGLCQQDVELIGATEPWLRYRLPRRFVRKTSPVCIGQKQIWFLLRLCEQASPFRLDATDQPEFDRWRWIDYWEPVREVVFFKRTVYAQALDQLKTVAFPENPPKRPRWVGSKMRSYGKSPRRTRGKLQGDAKG
jgi:putative (di)nucleoside polyphosphate hydrolase